MTEINFQNLIGLSYQWPVQLDWSTAHHLIKGLRLASKPYPVSITEVEANFMMRHIIEKEYKSGFELATGLGISTLAIGLGMKETGGTLLTVDNYSEEQLQIQPIGVPPENAIWEDYPDCYRMFQILKAHFGLPVTQLMMSATRIYQRLQSLEPISLISKFDFVFLDCPKDDNDLKRDLDGIFPFLAEKYTIFIHDSHCFTKVGEDYFVEKFGRLYDKIHTFGEVGQFFPLAMFCKD